MTPATPGEGSGDKPEGRPELGLHDIDYWANDPTGDYPITTGRGKITALSRYALSLEAEIVRLKGDTKLAHEGMPDDSSGASVAEYEYIDRQGSPRWFEWAKDAPREKLIEFLAIGNVERILHRRARLMIEARIAQAESERDAMAGELDACRKELWTEHSWALDDKGHSGKCSACALLSRPTPDRVAVVKAEKELLTAYIRWEEAETPTIREEMLKLIPGAWAVYRAAKEKAGQ